MSGSSLRIAVLASGSGSNLQALIDARDQGALLGELVLVVTDRAEAGAMQRALRHHIPALYLPLRRSQPRETWAEHLARLIDPFAPDLLVLAGWMKIMPAPFVAHFEGRMINQHPALLPDEGSDIYTTSSGQVIPALRGAHVVRDALEQGLAITGCSVHLVTPEVDMGPVIGRAELPIEPGETEASLHERIKELERGLLVEVVNRLARTREPMSS